MHVDMLNIKNSNFEGLIPMAVASYHEIQNNFEKFENLKGIELKD